MMLLIIISLAVLLGVGLIWFADFQPGFVLLQYGSWSIETSLVVFMVFFILLLVLGYMSIRSVMMLRKTPSRLSSWKKEKNRRNANRTLTRGLILLEEGRWPEAERTLLRHVSISDLPLLHYLGAARAAQQQQADDRRDRYLLLAQDTPDAEIAIGIVQAECQLYAGQKQQALETLEKLKQSAPKNSHVLKTLRSLYQDMDQWQQAQALLPAMRKTNVIGVAQERDLSQEDVASDLEKAVTERDWQKLSAIWEKLSPKSRHQKAVLKPYLNGLILKGDADQAGLLIEQFMKRDWSDELVYLYGTLLQGNVLTRLSHAEKWLETKPEDPWLLLTLGRLAKANKLWPKAEDYLLLSLKFGARGETYQLLATVQSAQGKDTEAAISYKNGLNFMLEMDV